MSYVLAIDVGTSFTAAALFKDDQPFPESLTLGLRGTAVPSVIYYPEEGPVLVGEAAERRGLDDPARVVREFKRRIGDIVPIAVGTLALPAEDIYATMARWVADRAEEREGTPPSEIVISHPAAWGGHRTPAVLAALAAKGMHNVTLISEPEAAALHYASQVRVEDGSTIAVYDLGGGTFDTAILRKASSGHFEFLGGPEGIEGLGGADFDSAVLRHIAEHTGDALAAIDPDEPGTLAALARLRRECVEAKEALSADSEASISVLLPGVQQQVRLVRSEFEAMIQEPIRETVDALERSLDQLGLEPADLTAVLLIGGSSRIPLVAQLISEQLDRPIAVDADPKSSICLGAAVAAVNAAAALAAEAEHAASTVPEIPAPADLIVEPHDADRRASWSRKSGASFGSWAGTAAVGDGARGVAANHGHAAKTGAHAPRPAVRLTAVAAGAALFTILTATAAQSPEGLGSLSAMFAPPAIPAPPTSDKDGDSGAKDSEKGLDVNAQPPADTSAEGLEAAASPSSTSSASAPPSAGGSTPESAPGGSSATKDPTKAAAPGTTAPVTPAPNPTTPVPVTTTPAPAPSTAEPVPTTPEPVPSTPDPVPTTPEPVPTTPDPVPTTPEPVPTSAEPVPTTPEPSLEPAPSTVAPAPTSDPPPAPSSTGTDPVPTGSGA